MSNQVTTRHGQDISDQFQYFLLKTIKKEGFYPVPLMVLTDNGFDVYELKMADAQALATFCKAASDGNVKAAMIGIDRKVPPEHPTEFQDILTCVLYEQPGSAFEISRARSRFKFGVVEYLFQPRKESVVRRINWNNTFWNTQMQSELYRYIPDVMYGSNGRVISEGSRLVQ